MDSLQFGIIVVACLFILIGIYYSIEYLEDKDSGAIRIAAGCVIIGALFAFFASTVYPDLMEFAKEVDAQYEAYNSELEEKCETYTIYLDGQEVAADTIDIHLYTVSVDDSKEVIYLTKKENSNFIFIPFFH